MIGVIATIEVAEGRREELLRAYQKLVPLIRANEPGCIEYLPMIDRPTDLGNQQPLRPNTIIVIEKWKDMDAFLAHLNAPHVVAFRAETAAIRRSVTLQVLEPLLK